MTTFLQCVIVIVMGMKSGQIKDPFKILLGGMFYNDFHWKSKVV